MGEFSITSHERAGRSGPSMSALASRSDQPRGSVVGATETRHPVPWGWNTRRDRLNTRSSTYVERVM